MSLNQCLESCSPHLPEVTGSASRSCPEVSEDIPCIQLSTNCGICRGSENRSPTDTVGQRWIIVSPFLSTQTPSEQWWQNGNCYFMSKPQQLPGSPWKKGTFVLFPWRKLWAPQWGYLTLRQLFCQRRSEQCQVGFPRLKWSIGSSSEGYYQVPSPLQTTPLPSRPVLPPSYHPPHFPHPKMLHCWPMVTLNMVSSVAVTPGCWGSAPMVLGRGQVVEHLAVLQIVLFGVFLWCALWCICDTFNWWYWGITGEKSHRVGAFAIFQCTVPDIPCTAGSQMLAHILLILYFLSSLSSYPFAMPQGGCQQLRWKQIAHFKKIQS